jgi:hypothetical protein
MSVCYDLNIYKGADFVFKFRLRSDNDYLNPTEVTFKASASSDGSAVIDKSLSDSPTDITIDSSDNYLITITVPYSETDAITQANLVYQIDATISGLIYRKLMGNIRLYEAIS